MSAREKMETAQHRTFQLKTANARGVSLKGGMQRRIAITFSEADFENLKSIAINDDRSIAQVVRTIISAALSRSAT